MSLPALDSAIGEIYRQESRRVLATLVRLLGDIDLAEEGLQEAFMVAADRWPETGLPDNPGAWLISTGRFKAIDRIRKRERFDRVLRDPVYRADLDADPESVVDDGAVEDDRLRLVFTCCHPAVTPDAQVAMTLRTVCGMTTEEIGRAFLTSTPTVAQRIVRAKAKIREDRIPYEVPGPAELPGRLDAVLRTVYLVFNEGYSPSQGDDLTRPELIDEAIHLGRVLVDLLPDPETFGLLSLMLLHESRRPARLTESGELILLADQDRNLWDRSLIAEGIELMERAWAYGEVGTYTLQASIAAVHAQAQTPADTDWARIVELYDLLLEADPSPVIGLNRGVAVAMLDGPDAGLRIIDDVLAGGDLDDYHLAHSARADLLRTMGRDDEAQLAYETALATARQEVDRRFIRRRLAEIGG